MGKDIGRYYKYNRSKNFKSNSQDIIFKNALHNLVIELCSAIFFKNIAQLFINFTHSFVAIE